MDCPTDDLGPLPIGDRQDTLQQMSLRAVRNRLPEHKFLVRDVRVDDKGVDCSLEAKVEIRVPGKDGGEEVKHQFTNFLAQGQIKSVDKAKMNKDGSVSYPIETSNLNYLLNGTSPIYLLWMASTDEVRYAWAWDEWRRLDVETPGWKEQDTFKVRFQTVLDGNAVEAIHGRIIKEARLARRIGEILARSSLYESVVVSIDPKALQTTDPVELYRWLTSSGMTIVSSGYGRQVMEWLGALIPDHRGDARVQLVAAYAQVSLGRGFEARGHLAAAALRVSDLSPTDRRFLEYLRDVCEYKTGKIDQAEYLRREREWSQRLTGVAAAEHRLEALRLERLQERNMDRRVELLEKMRAACHEIQGANDAGPSHKLQARIILMSAEGDDLASKFIERLSLLQARQGMGFSAVDMARRTSETMTGLWTEWEKGARGLVEEGESLRHPTLLAQALTAKAAVWQGLLLFERMEAAACRRPWEAPEQIIRALMQDVERALGFYSMAADLEGATQAKLLLADLFDDIGHEEAAKKLAEEAIAVAQAMNYPRQELHAKEHIEGSTLFRKFQASLARHMAGDEDVYVANQPDAEIEAMARYLLASLELPPERLPVLRRELVSLRAISRERIKWCRHIDLIQDKRHTFRRETLYVMDPTRFCICTKHQRKSNFGNTDAGLIIGAFKAALCEGCPDREPKATNAS